MIKLTVVIRLLNNNCLFNYHEISKMILNFIIEIYNTVSCF